MPIHTGQRIDAGVGSFGFVAVTKNTLNFDIGSGGHLPSPPKKIRENIFRAKIM